MIVVGLDVWCFIFGDYNWGTDWRLLLGGEIATAVEDYGGSPCKIKCECLIWKEKRMCI
jgi:hypothetical protein